MGATKRPSPRVATVRAYPVAVAVMRTLALGTAFPLGPCTSPSSEAPPDSDWAADGVAPGPAARRPTRRRGKYLRIEDLQTVYMPLTVLGEERPRRGLCIRGSGDQLPGTIIGSKRKRFRLSGSTVTFTQCTFGLPNVSTRVKLGTRCA